MTFITTAKFFFPIEYITNSVLRQNIWEQMQGYYIFINFAKFNFLFVFVKDCWH